MEKIEKKYNFENENFDLENEENAEIKCFISADSGTALITNKDGVILFKLYSDTGGLRFVDGK